MPSKQQSPPLNNGKMIWRCKKKHMGAFTMFGNAKPRYSFLLPPFYYASLLMLLLSPQKNYVATEFTAFHCSINYHESIAGFR